ncbi:unnamed protein product [Gongylonema pulchrum]|uniref:Uncharacterized protein n=1 Tax=Gongylonema pulchrum TaxID=637853 RepID=A0A3P6S9D4_9BILA|nr:unnamed protein product [Gongylonema pulchrum]
MYFQEEQLLQKKSKRDNANEVEIIKEFSGGYCSSIRFGLRIWYYQPWSEETRQPLGEHWMVTRANKHWFYGTFLNEETAVEFFGDSSEPRRENVVMIRGWFPRICARKL